MAQEWVRPPIPHYSFFQLLEIFPEAKGAMRRQVSENVKEIKSSLDHLLEKERKTHKDLLQVKDYKERELTRELVREFFIEPQRKDLESKLKRNLFYLAWLRGETRLHKGIKEEDLCRAKEVPITEIFPGTLRKSGNNLVGVCPLHEDHGPSFTVFTKQNRWHCFGSCSCGGDSIDFYRKLNNCDFITAVKKLCPWEDLENCKTR